MAFIPSKLGIYNASRSFPVKWNNPGWGITGEYDYWTWGDDYTEEGPLNVTIQDPSKEGCTIQFLSPTTITTDSSTVFHFYPRGITTALLGEDLPINLHSKAPGYYPANGTIKVPNTGGEYTVEYILNRSDIIKWDAAVVNATALVNMEVLDWDSCSIKFKVTVRANTQWNTDLTATIQLGAYYDTNKFISYSYGFKIEKSNTPEDLKLVVTPSSGTYGAAVIKNSSSIINLSINITQSVKSDISPIWKDYVWNEIISSDFIEYHLDYAGDMVYAGKAYKYPETDRVEFLLNNVAENYLSNGIIFNTSKTIISPEYLKPFTLITSSGNEKPITFFNDWSYKDRDLTKGTMLSDPITGLVDPRQYLVSSWILPTGTGVINRFFYIDGVQSTIDISLNSGINGYTYTEDLSNKLWPCGSYLIVGFVEGGNISDRQIRYDIDTTGKDYVLYYTNSAGGWDSLLVEGNVKKNDEIKSETYTRKVLNTSQEFARNKYLNTITSSWVLYTGYLNDIQASKMFNLIESTKVYLHNLKDNTITPVLITDTNCEYKTYTNQGKNKFYYTINVEASQDTYRK